ncbi:MAG: heat-inducible transcriptional repressor HrcA [Litorilinea sp.]
MSVSSLPLETLTERQRTILRLVVQEYVETAQPVGSTVIARQGELGVSPATIRNELAALERAGLLTHPHTSAGRIPTDAGYRFFVKHLMAAPELPSADRRYIRIQFGEVGQEMDQWLRLSTSLLARTTQSAALATAPRSHQSRYKHVELVAIHGAKILVVLVLQQGAVLQQMVDLEEPVAQPELSKISNELNDRLAGLGAPGIRKQDPILSAFAAQVADLIVDMMQRLDSQGASQIYRDGLTQVLDLPEFAEGDNVRRIVHVFEEPSLLEQVVEDFGHNLSGSLIESTGNRAGPAGDIHVLIAGDGRFAELRDISIVLARYGVYEEATGVLGVIGPVRMSYRRTMGAVRYVAALMSERVEELYGPQSQG